MSRTRPSIVGWLLSALLIIGSLWLWQSRQWVVDAVTYYQYEPSAQVRQIAHEAELTSEAKFMFYASRPEVQSSDQFNNNCQRREANSPILGCYSAHRIFIFDVTDERLDGIETVTAAHETLHAVWERLSDQEKSKLTPLLEAAYKKVTDDDLKERMAYYEKTEPGQSINELHSIIGTEYASIGPELEAYYKQYFKDRASIVKLHSEVDSVFTELSSESAALVKRIDALAQSINLATMSYNQAIIQLNLDVESFNQRARRSGGFTTQSEFEAELAALNQRRSALEASKQAIEADIVTYKSLLTQLETINAKASELNRSLDSTLQEIPTI
jgi:hypothetical protein